MNARKTVNIMNYSQTVQTNSSLMLLAAYPYDVICSTHYHLWGQLPL